MELIVWQLIKNGNLWAWGSNYYGQLGDGTTTNRTSPVQIKSGTKFKAVAAGEGHSLAIDSSGYLWAWGLNGNGQIGDETTTNRSTPKKILTSKKFKMVAAGRYHSLAIDSSGYLYSWGSDKYGAVGGHGSWNEIEKVPSQPKSGTTFVNIAAGANLSLAIDSSGNLWAWGYNTYGSVGNGQTTLVAHPTQIKNGTKFKAISAGFWTSFAIDTSGYLWAWGLGSQGQLGNNTTTEKQLTPVKVTSSIRFNEIDAGGYHTLAIDTSGNLWTWGENKNGILGDGTTTSQTSPIKITIK